MLDLVDVHVAGGLPIRGAVVVGMTYSGPRWFDVMTREGAILNNLPENLIVKAALDAVEI